MKIKKYLKESLKWVARTYVYGLLAVNAHICYDLYKNDVEKLNKPVSYFFEVREYKTKDSKGKEKSFTLVGEYHQYNKKEHELGMKLIDTHEHFASEYFDYKELSEENDRFDRMLWFLKGPGLTYRNLREGRFYDPITKSAQNRGKKIHKLEEINDALDSLSFTDKATWLMNMVPQFLFAPLKYYGCFSNNDGAISPSMKEKIITNRDKVMAQKIVNLLEKEGINNLLAVVGNAHSWGIHENLNKLVELEWLNKVEWPVHGPEYWMEKIRELEEEKK